MAPVNNSRDIDCTGTTVTVHMLGPDGEDLSFEPNLNPDRVDYVTDEGVEVWIERKHQKTRFLDAAGNQVGPVHANLVPAIVYARANRWTSPDDPAWWDEVMQIWIEAGGASDDDKRKAAGSWVPPKPEVCPTKGQIETAGDVLSWLHGFVDDEVERAGIRHVIRELGIAGAMG